MEPGGSESSERLSLSFRLTLTFLSMTQKQKQKKKLTQDFKAHRDTQRPFGGNRGSSVVPSSSTQHVFKAGEKLMLEHAAPCQKTRENTQTKLLPTDQSGLWKTA